MQKPIENIEALIWKYLEGVANAQERKAVDDWKSIPENQKDWDAYVALFGRFVEVESAHQPAEVNVDNAWAKVQQAIDGSEPKVVELNQQSTNFSWLKYAAAIVVSVGLGWWFVKGDYFNSNDASTFVSYAPVDSLRELNLPDGSLVSMKAGASLAYQEEGQLRKVSFEGDGYFEIERDTTKPFVIEVGDAVVSVLGTSFYINSISKEEVEVSVNSGKVKLSHIQPEKSSDYVLLEKGEKGKVKDRKKPLKETLETLNFLSWRSHKFRFKNTRLENVFQDLEDYYQVSFIVENQALLECRLSGKFYKQTLDELLDMLGMTFELEINRDQNKVTVQGEGCQ